MILLDVTKVTIDNWPNKPIFIEYLPIFIAVAAFILSILSFINSTKQYIKSSRPYVFAVNLANNKNGNIQPQPEKNLLKVKNSPARILSFKFSIITNSNILHEFNDKNSIQFPDDSIQTYEIKENIIELIKNNAYQNLKIFRKVKIEDYAPYIRVKNHLVMNY